MKAKVCRDSRWRLPRQGCNRTTQKPVQFKAASPEESEGDSGIVVKTNNEGDKYVDLGRKRRATVRAFKGTDLCRLESPRAATERPPLIQLGKPLLDIREYYGQEGDENPGKKGIALNQDEVRIRAVLSSPQLIASRQWEKLKANASAIDVLFKKVNK